MGEKHKSRLVVKTFINLIFIIITILIVFVAYLSYFCFTNQEIKPKFVSDCIQKVDKNKIISNIFTYFSKETGINKADNEKLYDENNYPKVNGSVVTTKLANAFMMDFTNSSPNKTITNHIGMQNAFDKLINKELDLIIVSSLTNNEKEKAKQKNIELNMDEVAKEGIVFMVSPENPVDSLTIEQIQKIYSGEITNWKELGGNDEKIMPYQNIENSSIQYDMQKIVMEDKELINPLVEDVKYKNENIFDVVSYYNNSAASIGYSYYYFANLINSNHQIKLLKINGIEPSNSTIQNGQYPLKTSYYIVTRNDKTEKAISLKNHMLSSRGQSIVEKAGYIPSK